jgi:hypothetical protein
MLRNGAQGACHLSRNVSLFMNVESDKEAVTMLLEDYMYIKHQSKKSPKVIQGDLQAWITSISTSSQVTQVWNNRDSTRLMEIFHAFGEHFRHADVISTKWMRDNIHTNSGGVSTT